MKLRSTFQPRVTRWLWKFGAGSVLLSALFGCGSQALPSAGHSAKLPSQADELAIRSLMARLGDAINHHDWKRVEGMLTEDVVWEALPPIAFKLDGLPAVRGFFAGNDGKIEVLLYEMIASDVQLEGPERAQARSTMRELLHLKEAGAAIQIVGTYTDSFIKKDGRWLFSRRRFALRYEDDVALPKRLGGQSSRVSGAATAEP